MQNDFLSNETQNPRIVSKNSIKNLIIPKSLLFNDVIHSYDYKIKNGDDLTVSTHKNSGDVLSQNFSNECYPTDRLNSIRKKVFIQDIYFEQSKIRKDNFGQEIKKGGKHKICFADELGIIKSFIPDDNNLTEQITKSKKIKRYSPQNKSKYCLPKIRDIKSSNSLKKGRIFMMKNLYNIIKTKTNSNKKFINGYAHIINIENLKEETKLNTFFIKNRALAEEENVSCSCYCSIF